MNTDLVTARSLARGVVQKVTQPGDVRVAVCPPAVSLHAVSEIVRGTAIGLGAQNMHDADSGAFTGEVSAAMLRSVGCQYVILGHSERRQLFGETDATVNLKVKQALANDLQPIVCVGETLEQRRAGREKEVVERQVSAALDGIPLADATSLVFAYEPIWAIGTGETATPQQAQQIHAFIRDLLKGHFGETKGRKIHILYGGSVKPGNAAELFGRPDVNGGLIGGASLDAEAFAAIVEAAREA